MFARLSIFGRSAIVFVVAIAAVFASLGASSPAAFALPCTTTCPPVYTPPPPPPPPAPQLSIELARQTPDRSSLHVVGWTAQKDSPTTPLTVQISVDGGNPTAVIANVARPDIAALYPTYGQYHGFNVTLPASSGVQTVCVTAVHVGTVDTDKTGCRGTDDVVSFAATAISYDTAQAQIVNSTLDQLDKVTNTNGTDLQQSTTINGQSQLTDTEGWSDTYGLQVTVSSKFTVGFPVVGSEWTVTVQGSASFVHNGSTTSQTTFGWSQPVLVPAKSTVVATVAVTRTTLSVPYALTGNEVYASGAQVPYSINGTYTGVNSHDLEVALTQYNLDGTPAASPVLQPQATLLTQA